MFDLLKRLSEQPAVKFLIIMMIFSVFLAGCSVPKSQAQRKQEIIAQLRIINNDPLLYRIVEIERIKIHKAALLEKRADSAGEKSN